MEVVVAWEVDGLCMGSTDDDGSPLTCPILLKEPMNEKRVLVVLQ